MVPRRIILRTPERQGLELQGLELQGLELQGLELKVKHNRSSRFSRGNLRVTIRLLRREGS
jgi:uncharacterized protein YicC (UPF0701 family)